MLDKITMAVNGDPSRKFSKLWEVHILYSNTTIKLYNKMMLIEIQSKLPMSIYGSTVKILELEYKIETSTNNPLLFVSFEAAVND